MNKKLMVVVVPIIVLIFTCLLGSSSASANTVTVNDWDALNKAWSDDSVDKIILGNNIQTDRRGFSRHRNKAIEVDGQGKTLTANFTGNNGFQLNNGSATPVGSIFSLHDINIIQTQSNDVYGMFYSDEGSGSSKWIFKLSNLTYSQGDTTVGQRFMTVGGATMDLSGNVDIRTNYENFIGAGEINVAPNCHYYGVSNNSSKPTDGRYSTVSGAGQVSVWYMTATTGSGNINIGNGAIVSLVNYKKGNIFSPIYYKFNTVTINSGAVLNLNGGNNGMNWLSNNAGAGNGNYDVKSNANLTVSSNDNSGGASLVDYNTSGSGMQGISVEAGGTFYALGKTNNGIPLINMAGSNKNQYLKVDNPKGFDINNLSVGINNPAINTTNGTFSINNSDISIWANGMDTLHSSATDTFSKVKSFAYNGTINSSNVDLKNAYKNNSLSRISCLNQPEKMYVQKWSESEPSTETMTKLDGEIQNGLIWDTDKKIRVRVRIGQTPISGNPDFDTGLLPLGDVWAGKNQIKVSDGENTVGTDENGYAVFNTNPRTANINGGKGIHFKSIRSDGTGGSLVQSDVIAKYPPLPVKITSSAVSNEEIKGRVIYPSEIKTGRVNTITAQVSSDQGKTWNLVTNKATINKDNTFNLGKIDDLKAGDQVQIFATDVNGLTTPAADTPIHDVLAKGATKITIKGSLNWVSKFTSLDFGTHALDSKRVSYPALANTRESLEVSDTRGNGGTWRVTAQLIKPLTSNDGLSVLKSGLVYKNGQSDEALGRNEVLIGQYRTNSSNSVKINDKWNASNRGIFLDVPDQTRLKPQSYNGTVKWNLQDVVPNN
ncbi:pectate lyase-like adhesive domain-containing protein [Weissella viridescens]|uniref:pectate lyase-like adhesive domain-containing protein n=1 Tax=Weissella viridescens TaxID=1629 RepID=UPI003AF21A97